MNRDLYWILYVPYRNPNRAQKKTFVFNKMFLKKQPIFFVRHTKLGGKATVQQSVSRRSGYILENSAVI
jgi:hypothetical protein